MSTPDYLDSSDILLRNGHNELKPSTTGKWGERLSVGITHALEVALGRRLPEILVTHTQFQCQTTRRIVVYVTAFDFQPDGRCVLTARWSIPGADEKSAAISEQGHIRDTPATGVGAVLRCRRCRRDGSGDRPTRGSDRGQRQADVAPASDPPGERRPPGPPVKGRGPLKSVHWLGGGGRRA